MRGWDSSISWQSVGLKSQGAIVTRVRVPCEARDFSPRVNFRCRLLRCPCAVACFSICAHVLKIPNTGSHTIVGHTDILIVCPCISMSVYMHTLVGVGSAALTAAVPYPVEATRIFREGQRNIGRKEQEKRQKKYKKDMQSEMRHRVAISF